MPRSYLRSFSDEGTIGVVLTNTGERREISIRNAGVRKGFYKRHRPTTGERIDDVEWSLSVIESAAAPILRDVEARWPLSLEEKTLLAEFLSIQCLRGPRWHQEYGERTKALFEGYRRDGTFDHPELPDATNLVNKYEAHALGDSERMIRMMSMSPKGAAIFGSMIWNLVRFCSPFLACSDHPVSIWPINQPSRRPEPTTLNAGLLNVLEVWVPVSPKAAILMTWLDEEDDRAERVEAARHHASAINAFTVANADRQWFYLPGTTPPVGTGRFYPLSTEFIDGYNAEVARRSRIRAAIGERVNARLGENLPKDYDIVRLHERPASAT